MSPSEAPESDEPYCGHGFLLFGDFQRLDRETDLAGLAIDRGHARIDLVALGETLRTLVVAVAATGRRGG